MKYFCKSTVYECGWYSKLSKLWVGSSALMKGERLNYTCNMRDTFITIHMLSNFLTPVEKERMKRAITILPPKLLTVILEGHVLRRRNCST